MTATDLTVLAIALPTVSILLVVLHKTAQALVSVLLGVVTVQQKLPDKFSGDVVLDYLAAHSRVFRFGPQEYEAFWRPIRAEGRLKMAMRITQNKWDAERLTNEGADDTAAQFQWRCTKDAVERLWKEEAPNEGKAA